MARSGSASIKMIVIKPKVKFKPNAFNDAFHRAAEFQSKKTEQEFRKTHRTWNEQRPTWRREVQVRANATIWQVDTSHLIYFFLNDGTRVRYAAMTPGFKPKTKPGFIGSTAGQGGFSHLAFNPPPGPDGIEARYWDVAIQKKMIPVVIESYENAMKEGAKRSGHSI